MFFEDAQNISWSPVERSMDKRLDERLDEKLCEAIREVLRHRDGSREQRRAMDGLVQIIPSLKGISRRQYPRIEYREALNQALVALSVYQKKISGHPLRLFVRKFNLNLDSEDSANIAHIRECFVKRFNRILKNIIAQMYEKMDCHLSLDAPANPSSNGSATLGSLMFDFTENPIKQAEKAETMAIGRKVKLYIVEDPERKLRNCYPSGYPQSNCQELAKRRLLNEPPDKWKEIVRALEVPFGTVTAHWKRKCSPLLQEVVKNLGYQPE